MSANEAAAVWDALIGRGAVPVGARAMDLVRIENGTPDYGRELVEDYNPLEAGLMDFISFNKGCYIGQEVVARLNTYDKVQKHLVRLYWDGEDVPELPTILSHEGRSVGTLTSAAVALGGGRCIGLGYVRKAHVHENTRLLTEWGGEAVVEGMA